MTVHIFEEINDLIIVDYENFRNSVTKLEARGRYVMMGSTGNTQRSGIGKTSNGLIGPSTINTTRRVEGIVSQIVLGGMCEGRLEV